MEEDLDLRLRNIEEAVARIEELQRLLVRQKLSDKGDRLRSEIEQRGRMTTKHVRDFLNISKPHALTLMEKQASYPGFRMVKGDAAKGMPSSIIFDRSAVIQDQQRIIAVALAKQRSLTLHDLMERFAVDLVGARLIAQNFCAANGEYRLDENRLVPCG